MASPRKLAVLESSDSGALLLARTLKRKFPEAIVNQGITSASAAEFATDESIELYVVHRVPGEEAASVVRRIKAARPNAPVIMVSAIDRSKDAISAGADAFLLFDQWLMIGITAERLLARVADGDPV
jgi:DNA-binding response OmpR family regulator